MYVCTHIFTTYVATYVSVCVGLMHDVAKCICGSLQLMCADPLHV